MIDFELKFSNRLLNLLQTKKIEMLFASQSFIIYAINRLIEGLLFTKHMFCVKINEGFSN